MAKQLEEQSYKDFLVSGEEFHIRTQKKGILKTHPVPENLASYYKSENYISHTDRNESFQEKIYQEVKKYMLRQKASWIEKEIPKGKLLDYGCGTGDFVQCMCAREWESYGIEPDPDARNLAEKKSPNIFSSIQELGEEKFSVITLWHVLEHIPNYSEILSGLTGKLEKGGLLIIAVPNHNSHDATHYNNFWAAWDVPRHIWHFSRKGLIEEVTANFTVSYLKEKPLIFDSFYVSLLSEQHLQSKFAFFNAIKNGFYSNIKARASGEYSSLAYFFKKA